jgi:long-chain acyl-CoA synthetase
VSGGAAMPVEVMTAFEQAFGCVVLEGYGLSETSPVASFNLPARRKAGSIGTPVSGVEFRVVDDAGNDVACGDIGEIAIRGHNVMKGYWAKPEETARQDTDGFYFIVDRKKDMIIRGGYNVYPRSTTQFATYNPNYVGGDIINGANTMRQLVMRPRVALDPYSTGIAGRFICSASTPPGAGAHGMCGYHAANSALRHLRLAPVD